MLREQKTAEQKTELYRSRSPLVRADGAPYHFIANRCIVLAITIGSHVSIGTRKRTLKTCTGNNCPLEHQPFAEQLTRVRILYRG